MKKSLFLLAFAVLSLNIWAQEVYLNPGDSRSFDEYLTQTALGFSYYSLSLRDLPSEINFTDDGVRSESFSWPYSGYRYYGMFTISVDPAAAIGTYTFYVDYTLHFGSTTNEQTVEVIVHVEDPVQDHDFSIANLTVEPATQHAGEECGVQFDQVYG